eukprot:UN11943
MGEMSSISFQYYPYIEEIIYCTCFLQFSGRRPHLITNTMDL